jgi:hypothetical protein
MAKAKLQIRQNQKITTTKPINNSSLLLKAEAYRKRNEILERNEAVNSKCRTYGKFSWMLGLRESKSQAKYKQNASKNGYYPSNISK